MRKYKIIFYFADRDGKQETYEDGSPKFNDEIIFAYNGGEAIEKLKAICEQEPEIVLVREVQKNERIM